MTNIPHHFRPETTPVQQELELLWPAKSYDFLGDFTFAEEPAYSIFYLQDNNEQSGHNKLRRISAPNAAMKAIQERLVDRIRALGIDNPSATGGLPGCSTVKNVARHAGNRFFYQTDIKSAYKQVDPAQLAFLMVELGFEWATQAELKQFIVDYCLDTEEGGLVTGSPSSPDLFNLYMLPIDEMMRQFADEHGLTYTRYIDDLTFSAPDLGRDDFGRIGAQKRKVIRKILNDAGFPISDDKTRVDDLHEGPVTITGIQLNPNGSWQLPTHSQRRLQRIMDEFESQLSVGWPLEEFQLGQLSSVNGILQASRDKRRVFMTDGERALLRRYRRLVKLNKIHSSYKR